MTGQLKILVAGGDTELASAVDLALGSAGLSAQVVRVDDGCEAVHALGTWASDCAFVDTGLSNADGLAVLREASRLNFETPVVLVSRGNGTMSVPDMLKAGAFDSVAAEDLDNGRLSHVLRLAVRLSRAERQANLAEQFLAHQALHDPLTGLPNRTLFDDRLGNAIAVAVRENNPVAILVVDLNRFGEINKTLGHAIGDLLLEQVGARLQEVLRTSDTVARLAGDEFAVLLSTGASLNGAVSAAGKIIDALKEPVVLDGHRLAIGVSIGVALFPAHGSDGMTVVRHAGMAMAEAKRNNSGFAIFAGTDESESLHEMSLAGDLHHVIEKAELVLHYQPVINLKSGAVCGAEALLRWQHPEHGLISPAVFIPLAERTGEIEALTLWVLDSVLSRCRVWHNLGYDFPISVNISAVMLHNPEFSEQVADLSRKWNVSVDRLKLEITESAIISDVVRATETVTRLHKMGVRISIDDFGTGYSSIAYLRRLPVAEVKVDKSYVLNMNRNTDDAVIVRSVVELGHNLGLQVIAEGVEDIETWNLLVDYGCDAVQGFYISRPIDAQAFEHWLATSEWGMKSSPRKRA